MRLLGRLRAYGRGSERSPSSKRRRSALALALGLLLFLVVYIVAVVYSIPSSPGNNVRYDEYLNDLKAGRIDSATILAADRRVVGTYGGGRYWLDFGTSDASPLFGTIMQSLQQTNVPVYVDQQWLKGLVNGPQFTVILPTLILVDALVLIYVMVQGGGLMGFARSGSRRVNIGESKITFSDVAGVQEAVEELAEVRDFLGDPSRFLSMGARIPRGILLTGPPGCGKTLLARAVAGESEARFFSISGSAFVELYVGVGAARIRDLFREAQQAAPAIIFIDELDAVGRGRSTTGANGQDERESTLNQLLVGLDGFDREVGVVVIAATNRPDILDPALLRPGRFDRRITVEPPDLAGRVQVLGVHARGKPMAGDIDLAELARRTPGFSGADLASVVNEAALLAARRGHDRITNALLNEAVERLIAGPATRSKLLSPEEKRLLAYHEAGHAVVSAVARPSARLGKISLLARGLDISGHEPDAERHVATGEQLMGRLITLMGGPAADRLMGGASARCSADDLERATELAHRMVAELGMSERLGPVSLKVGVASLQSESQTAPSQEMVAIVDAEVRRLLVEARDGAERALTEHRAALDRLAGRLQEVESLEEHEIADLWQPRVEPAVVAS